MTDLQQLQAKATADRDLANRAVAKRNASRTKHELAKQARSAAQLAETRAYDDYLQLCDVASQAGADADRSEADAKWLAVELKSRSAGPMAALGRRIMGDPNQRDSAQAYVTAVEQLAKAEADRRTAIEKAVK